MSNFIRTKAGSAGQYWEVSKIYLKTQLAWKADVLLTLVFNVTKILFACLLWGMIFEEKETVGPFTFHSMLSYYVASTFLSQLEMSRRISTEIHDRIRNGTFSKYLVLPIGIEGYFLAMEFGIVLFYLAFDFLAAVVWVFVFRIRFVFTESLWVMACAVLMAALGLLFMAQFHYLLGLFTLKFQGIRIFLLIKDNLAALITGSIVPLALFPEAVIHFMKILPFYYVTYLPAMLFTGFCREEALSGIIIICSWCLAMQLLIHVVYQKYIKKYDGVGI